MKRPIQRKISDLKPNKQIRYATVTQVAEFLNCSERMVRNYCKQKLIPAVQTRGGHHRIPLSLETKWAMDRLKNPQFWKRPVGSFRPNTDEVWEVWVQIAKLHGLKGVITDEYDVMRADPQKYEKLKRAIIKLSNRRSRLDRLILEGWMRKLLRDGKKLTVTSLIARMKISRDTFYRKFRPAEVRAIRQRVLRSLRTEVTLVDWSQLPESGFQTFQGPKP